MCHRFLQSILVVVTAALVVSQSALGITPREPKAALIKVAPDQCLFFFHSFGFTEADANSSNKTEQLFADPDIRRLINEVRKLADNAVAMAIEENQEGEAAENARVMYTLATKLIAQPMTLYVGKVDIKTEQIDAGFVIDAGEHIDALSDLLGKLQASADEDEVSVEQIGGLECYRIQSDDGAPPLYWTVNRSTLVVTVGDQSIEGLLARLKTPPPAWLKTVVERLPVPRRSMLSYLNGKELARLVGEAPDPEGAKAWDALGFSEIESISFVAGLDEEGYLSRAVISAPQLKGLMKILDNTGVDRRSLESVPSSAQFAMAAQMEPKLVLDTLEEFTSNMDPEAAAQMTAGLAQSGQMLGFDVREDVINAFGDQWLIYQSGMGMMMMPELIATVDLRDRARFEDALKKIVALAEQAIAQQQGGPPVSISETDLEGHKGYILQGMPVAPIWCVADDRLLISTSAGSLKSYLNADVATSDSLAANQRIAELFAGESAPAAVAFSDLKTNLEAMYPMMQMGINMGVGQLKQQTGLEFDLGAIPPIESITKYLNPSVYSMSRVADGIEMTASETLPNVTVSTGSAPVVVALLLPAVQAAREAARRTTSMNNLRQIALGLLNYESAQRAFPTASKNGLSWRVAILPYVDEQALYDQFHLDEPWDSEHNQKLIARIPETYRSPTSTLDPSEGKTNYLAIRAPNSILVEGDKGTGIRDITDGTSQTILAVEVNDDRAVIWTKPDDFAYDESDPKSGLGGMYAGEIFLAVFGDGHVAAIPTTVDRANLQGMYTRDGGELITVP